MSNVTNNPNAPSRPLQQAGSASGPKLCAGCDWWTPQQADTSKGLMGWCDVFVKRTEATHGSKCTAWTPLETPNAPGERPPTDGVRTRPKA